MTCEEIRFLVALEAANGLTPEQKGTLNAHLAHCAECRLEVDAFAGLDIPPHACAAVRARVLEQLEKTSRRRRWWIWPAAATALAACLVLLGIAVQPKPAPPPMARVTVKTAPPDVVPSDVVPPSVIRAKVRPHRRKRPPVSQTEPLVVKMYTDDPQVVIYWIADGTGE